MGAVAKIVERELLSWPGVKAGPHRFGGREFRYDRREIGHLHGDRLADLLFPVRIRKELVAAGRARPHHVLPETGWVSFYINGLEDILTVLDLFRLNYERLAHKRPVDPTVTEAAQGATRSPHDGRTPHRAAQSFRQEHPEHQPRNNRSF